MKHHASHLTSGPTRSVTTHLFIAAGFAFVSHTYATILAGPPPAADPGLAEGIGIVALVVTFYGSLIFMTLHDIRAALQRRPPLSSPEEPK